MKNFNKLPIALLVGIAAGCSTTSSCPFNASGEDCERITITAYLPPIVADLDYKVIQGSLFGDNYPVRSATTILTG